MVKKLKKLLNIYGYWNTLAPTSADGHGTMIRDARQFNNMWSKRFRRNTLLAVTQDYCKAMPPSAAIEKMRLVVKDVLFSCAHDLTLYTNASIALKK